MRCYYCERTPHQTRYRLGRDGLCEYETLEDCEKALEVWRKKQRPPRPGFIYPLLFVYLMLL